MQVTRNQKISFSAPVPVDLQTSHAQSLVELGIASFGFLLPVNGTSCVKEWAQNIRTGYTDIRARMVAYALHQMAVHVDPRWSAVSLAGRNKAIHIALLLDDNENERASLCLKEVTLDLNEQHKSLFINLVNEFRMETFNPIPTL